MVRGSRTSCGVPVDPRLLQPLQRDAHRTSAETEFPTYRLVSVPEPYDYYVDHFREQRRRAILVDGIIGANAALEDGDPHTAQSHMSKSLYQLGKETTALVDENAIGKMRSRLDRYDEARKSAGQLTGVATGFPTLDFITGGFHEQQFVLFGGAPKQCKSFALMRSVIAAHDQGRKVLFVSFEMSQFEQLARYDGVTCGVNATKIIHGSLDDDDMLRLKRGMRSRKNLEPFIISADISATTTVSGLSAKIDQHQPDIIFVDGVYLMESETNAEPQSPQAFTSISRGLKRLAQRTKRPLIGTTQALTSKMGRDRAVTMHSLGWRVMRRRRFLRLRGGKLMNALQVGDLVLTLNHENGLAEAEARTGRGCIFSAASKHGIDGKWYEVLVTRH